MNHVISSDGTCKGLLRNLQKKSDLLSTILNVKILSLSCSYHDPKNNGIKFGAPGILSPTWCWVTLVFYPTFHDEAIKSDHLSLSLLTVTLVPQHIPVPEAVLPPFKGPLFPPPLPALFCQPQSVFARRCEELLFPASVSSWLQDQSCPRVRLVGTPWIRITEFLIFLQASASVGTGSNLCKCAGLRG